MESGQSAGAACRRFDRCTSLPHQLEDYRRVVRWLFYAQVFCLLRSFKPSRRWNTPSDVTGLCCAWQPPLRVLRTESATCPPTLFTWTIGVLQPVLRRLMLQSCTRLSPPVDRSPPENLTPDLSARLVPELSNKTLNLRFSV
ncbi:hypothetical protein CRENBAI_001344 [Crenichthys baileyi]|uniref:Uncharacterized protein n=1 Tax=Crenichthys baileyi TaxID=28760 RepID=A0AAV9QTE7_9TELE